MKADVAIITALQREYEAFYRTAESKFNMNWHKLDNLPRKAIRQYQIAENRSGLRIALVHAGDKGQLQAAIVTHDIIRDLSPQLILLVGIAAGIGNEVKLGDVVISKQFIDYEMVKLTDDGPKREFRSYSTKNALSVALTNFRDTSWKEKICAHRPDETGSIKTVVHYGDIFSGNKVVADSTTAQELLNYCRKAVALEMESFGVAFVLDQINSSTLFGMVKGISDTADSSKNDTWHEYATHAPSAFVLDFLQNTPQLLRPSDGRTPVTDINEETNQIIHDLGIDPSRIAHYERDLIRNIVKATLKEANAILSEQYESDIDHGQHFLLRAAPLFGKASEVYAVSLDTVSTFWVNEDNRELAHTYLDHQAPNGTMNRLFVFSDAYTAHWYARVLDYHYEKYQNVFVCSMQHYRKYLLPNIRGSKSVDELLHRDFGLLMYKECEIELFAELNERSLDYKRIDAERPEEINYNRLIQCFQEFQTLRRGSLGGDRRCVLRWHQGFWQDKSKWTNILKEMFKERTSDAFHLVFFNCDQGHEDELRAHLADIKGKIMNGDGDSLEPVGRTYGIRDVWFGRKNESLRNEPRDGKFGGDLRVNADAALFLLIIHFQDEDGLMRFYADSQHSEIRQNVYKTLDNRTHTLYELASNSKLNNSKKRKKIIYEAIEALVSPKIMRKDYLNHEMIHEMVIATDPYKF